MVNTHFALRVALAVPVARRRALSSDSRSEAERHPVQSQHQAGYITGAAASSVNCPRSSAMVLHRCPSYRIAVMIVGELDSQGMAAFNASGYWQSHERHIIRPLLKASIATDTFICDNGRAHELPGTILERLQVRVSKPITAATSLTHRQALCFQVAQEWLQEGTRASCFFTHFLWTRFDHQWFADVPSPLELPTDAVALRARLVVANVEVGADMMSWIGCGTHTGTGAKICTSGIASLESMNGGIATKFKECIIVDDQVAVVPASIAQKLFASHGYGLHGFPKTTKSALNVSLPAAPGADGSLRSEASVHVWNVCPSPCWPWQNNSGEARLTYRLASQEIPVHLASMRARLPTINRHSKVAYPVPHGSAPLIRCPA